MHPPDKKEAEIPEGWTSRVKKRKPRERGPSPLYKFPDFAVRPTAQARGELGCGVLGGF